MFGFIVHLLNHSFNGYAKCYNQSSNFPTPLVYDFSIVIVISMSKIKLRFAKIKTFIHISIKWTQPPYPFPFNNQQSMITEIAHPISFSDQKGGEAKPHSLKPKLNFRTTIISLIIAYRE